MFIRTDLPRVDARGPKAPPIIGPMGGVLKFFADPVTTMIELHRTYGDVASVSDRNAALVCAFGAAHNQTVITQLSTFEHLSELPVPGKPGSALARLSNNVVFKNGDAHRVRRRQLMPAFSKLAVEGYAGDILDVADRLLPGWPSDSVTNVGPLLRDLTASVATRCLFGLKTVDGVDELGRMEIELLSTIASPLSLLLPVALPGTPYRKGLVLAEQIEKRIQAVIAEKKQKPDGTDALSRLIHSKDDDGEPLSDEDLAAESNSLFAAGFDTSAHTLTWTLLLLATHPHVLDEVRAEIRDVVGDGAPTPAHVSSLVKLDRAIKESMRLLPVAVLLFVRVVAEDARVGDMTLPKGAHLILSPIVTHRDPKIFPSPQRFDPSRWSTVDPTIYEYLPFGAGARMCIGASFATLALRLMLIRILQRFRPALPAAERVDYAVRGPALGPKGGLRLLLAPSTPTSAASATSGTAPRGTIRRLVDFT